MRAEASGLGSPAIHLFGAAAFVELGVTTGSVFSPGVRFYAAYGPSPAVTVDDASARFALLTGRIELLPLRFEAGRLEVVPGMVAELGTISATGEPSRSFTGFPPQHRAWFALGEELAIRVAVAGAFYAGLTFGLAEPLRRYTFFFQNPNISVADVPSVETVTALEAGLHFL